jgi:hypothetical protein
VKRVTELTGLDPTFVRRSGGRLETQAYLREVFRAEGKLGSRYDSNVTVWDPFPFAPNQRTNDPLLDAIIAPTTTAMVDFITHTVGWKYAGRYDALSYEVDKAVDGCGRKGRSERPHRARLGRGVATIRRRGPEAECLDRARLGRSVVPLHGLSVDRRSNAAHG